MILGIKMINATIRANMAASSTAPAAMSLISPAFKLYAGETRFTSFSMAVLMASVIQTSAMDRQIQSQSAFSISSIKPAMIATADASRCTLALFSFLKNAYKPLKAKEKLLTHFFSFIIGLNMVLEMDDAV